MGWVCVARGRGDVRSGAAGDAGRIVKAPRRGSAPSSCNADPSHFPDRLLRKPHMFDLGGKSALVTGASGGIGAAIARALHGAGAKVVLAGTLPPGRAALACALGGRAL